MTVSAHVGEEGTLTTTSAKAVRVAPAASDWERAMADPGFVADMEEFLELSAASDAELCGDSEE
ncbi:MAG TPA: hypothetical protein VNN74_03920 [Candidatus Micrarchaeia archaeon]|nr:hypothetical protein [Candidatus Micrarchaeia archaeon]